MTTLKRKDKIKMSDPINVSVGWVSFKITLGTTISVDKKGNISLTGPRGKVTDLHKSLLAPIADFSRTPLTANSPKEAVKRASSVSQVKHEHLPSHPFFAGWASMFAITGGNIIFKAAGRDADGRKLFKTQMGELELFAEEEKPPKLLYLIENGTTYYPRSEKKASTVKRTYVRQTKDGEQIKSVEAVRVPVSKLQQHVDEELMRKAKRDEQKRQKKQRRLEAEKQAVYDKIDELQRQRDEERAAEFHPLTDEQVLYANGLPVTSHLKPSFSIVPDGDYIIIKERDGSTKRYKSNKNLLSSLAKRIVAEQQAG